MLLAEEPALLAGLDGTDFEPVAKAVRRALADAAAAGGAVAGGAVAAGG